MSTKVKRVWLAWAAAALVLLVGCETVTTIQQDTMKIDVKAPRQWMAGDGRKYDIMVGHGRGKEAAYQALGKVGVGEPPYRYITDLLVYAVEAGKRGDPTAEKTAIQNIKPVRPTVTVRVKLFSPSSRLYFWSGQRWEKAELYDPDKTAKPPTDNIRIGGFKQDGIYVTFTIIAWPPTDTDTADG